MGSLSPNQDLFRMVRAFLDCWAVSFEVDRRTKKVVYKRGFRYPTWGYDTGTDIRFDDYLFSSFDSSLILQVSLKVAAFGRCIGVCGSFGFGARFGAD